MKVGDEQVRLSAGKMAGSDELRTAAFFPNAALVSVFDDVLFPVEGRVPVTPPPEADLPNTPVETVETSA